MTPLRERDANWQTQPQSQDGEDLAGLYDSQGQSQWFRLEQEWKSERLQ